MGRQTDRKVGSYHVPKGLLDVLLTTALGG